MSDQIRHFLFYRTNVPFGSKLVYLVFLFRFFDVDDFTAFVVATARANCVRQAHLTAVRTLGQILRGEEIIRAAAITSCTGNSPFRKWCHLLYSSIQRKYTIF